MNKFDRDLYLSKFTINPNVINKRFHTDNFNGYGKQRSNQNVTYGTYAQYVKKAWNLLD